MGTVAAQKATELRRLLAEVAANEQALRRRQAELEAQLVAAPAAQDPPQAEIDRFRALRLRASARRGEGRASLVS